MLSWTMVANAFNPSTWEAEASAFFKKKKTKTKNKKQQQQKKKTLNGGHVKAGARNGVCI